MFIILDIFNFFLFKYRNTIEIIPNNFNGNYFLNFILIY
jgi:hypothetical protein